MTTAAHFENTPNHEPHGLAQPIHRHHVNYILIFFALVALTVITVLVALHRFDDELVNVLLALLVASIKAIFVAMYFMHLKFEGKLIYLILLIPVVLTITLVASLVPDVTHGTHHIMAAPPIIQHDVSPLTPY
jgi:cytochrome c oxidase subunit 4